ncbi:MarR family winged helix-turn-helix transcriptional regulator [Arthrobacter sp. GCM10027362]|uniref:MarR family winged helix-turn-helix transcriptional regulator n=1 Tax=Arthrobacter sp. GCM10027362 TaxID=3273379 RepID=UPI00362BD0D0
MAAEARDADFIDRARQGWRKAWPGLDTSGMELMGRITRISAQTVQLLDQVLAPAGVARAEFDVLCALARSERPLRASEVTAATLFSSAATTKHAARLEQAGLVQRRRLERDGRVVLLELTGTGRALVETEMPRCMELDRALLEGIGEDELAALAALLRRISRNTEAYAAR